MKKRLFTYTLIVALTSCFGNINPKTTDEELNAVKDVVNYYGGHCEYGTYIQVSTNDSKHYYFGLKLSGSPLIGNPKTDNILAGGIAYRFYSSLKKEVNTFDQIRTEIVDSNGKSKKYVYDIAELAKVKSEMPKAVIVVDLLKKRDYYGLVNLCDSSYIDDKKTVIASLQKSEKEYGIATDFRILGFEFYKNKEGNINLSICGTVLSTVKNHVLKVVTDPNDKSLKIILFNYRY